MAAETLLLPCCEFLFTTNYSGNKHNTLYNVCVYCRGVVKVSVLPLIEIIKRRVAPRARIISDGWVSYSGLLGLEDHEYPHEVINHNKNFVHPENPDVHTQWIEGFWILLKRFLRNEGSHRNPHG